MTDKPLFTRETDFFERTIFLDIEGVLVTHRSIQAAAHIHGPYNPHGPKFGEYIDPVSLQLVARLATECQADIAITSTLRTDSNCMFAVRNQMMAYIKQLSSPYKDFEVVFEATGTEHATREEQIESFAESFGTASYAVFDDRNLKVKNFLQCDPRTGILYQDYVNAKQTLLPVDHPERVFRPILI